MGADTAVERGAVRGVVRSGSAAASPCTRPAALPREKDEAIVAIRTYRRTNWRWWDLDVYVVGAMGRSLDDVLAHARARHNLGEVFTEGAMSFAVPWDGHERGTIQLRASA